MIRNRVKSAVEPPAPSSDAVGAFASSLHAVIHNSPTLAWARVLTPFWGSRLCRYSTAEVPGDLAVRCASTGITPESACFLSLASLGAALSPAGIADADVGVVFGALRATAAGGGAAPAAALTAEDTATAPPPQLAFRRGVETRVAAAGAFAVTTSERNVHGAFGLAGGAALLTLWKSLQDETTAAAAAGKSLGVGQDVYLGVLAAAVPLMAGAVAMSMALFTTTQVVAVTDFTASRYLSLPSAARYADVITFATSGIAAAISHAFLLSATPQGDWVTWIFVGCTVAAVASLVPAIVFFMWTMRRPFSSRSAAAATIAAGDSTDGSVRGRKEEFGRLLVASAVARKTAASAAFADHVRRAAAGLAYEAPPPAPAVPPPQRYYYNCRP